MKWVVLISRRVQKALKKLPVDVVEGLEVLIVDLQDGGPVRGDWPNYSKLAPKTHHCHLNYSYVAIWMESDKALKIVEVIYVGSRENAPY